MTVPVPQSDADRVPPLALTEGARSLSGVAVGIAAVPSLSRAVLPAAAVRSLQAHADQRRLRRRQINHDIQHELATVMLLATLLTTAADVGPDSRERARQILGESRWLEQLTRALEEAIDHDVTLWQEPPEPIRLDLVAKEIVEAMRLSTLTKIGISAEPVWAHVDRLAFWRALRNVMDNAVRAAGAQGRVQVRIFAGDGWASVQVDDDGPGFGTIPAGRASLGLGIVQDMAVNVGGHLEIRRGSLGGCCVCLQLPAVSAADYGDQPSLIVPMAPPEAPALDRAGLVDSLDSAPLALAGRQSPAPQPAVRPAGPGESLVPAYPAMAPAWEYNGVALYEPTVVVMWRDDQLTEFDGEATEPGQGAGSGETAA